MDEAKKTQEEQVHTAFNFPLEEHLRIGQTLEVTVQTLKKERFMTRFVGCRAGQYLIIEQPDAKRYGYMRDAIQNESSLVVRTIFENTSGEVAAFASHVVVKMNHPARLLFIAFPKEVESKELRKERRQSVSIKARVYDAMGASEESKITGLVTNICSGGCRFECEQDSGPDLNAERLFVELFHPTANTPEIKQATVRSYKKEQGRLCIGMSFD